MKPSKSLIILIVLSFFAIACGKKPEFAIFNEHQLIETYADLLILNERYKSSTSTMDSTQYAKEFQQILANRGTTQEQFRMQVMSQLESPQKFRQFYDKLYNTVEHRRTKS